MSSRCRIHKQLSLVKITGSLLVVTILLFLMSSCGVSHAPSHKYDIYQYNPANQKQHNTDIQMGIYNGELYIYTNRYLYMVNGIDLQPIERFEHIGNSACEIFLDRSPFAESLCSRIAPYLGSNTYAICINEDGFYYSQILVDDTWYLMHYDMSSGQKTTLLKPEYITQSYLSQDGILYVTDNQYPTCYAIDGVTVTGPQLAPELFAFERKTYTTEKIGTNIEVVCYDETNTQYVFDQEIPYGQKSLIPCKNGLLVHNEGRGDLLYYIDGASGEVTELFAVDCLVSISAVNVYQDYAYLSFSRYGAGEIGIVGYKDDSAKGTYRINLNNYSVEKMSDEVYRGLFVFDDSGIFACDIKGDVYRLDFDCQRIAKLGK